ncbi:hypothetical protein [Glycomyces buryatensis]|nr:hypothetical protein [Glycomyces buryatensis]
MPTAAKDPQAERPKRRVGHPRLTPDAGDGDPRGRLLAAAAA